MHSCDLRHSIAVLLSIISYCFNYEICHYIHELSLLFYTFYSAPKITIASVKDRLISDKSLIPGVPLVAEAISTDKRFMQYRKYVCIDCHYVV